MSTSSASPIFRKEVKVQSQAFRLQVRRLQIRITTQNEVKKIQLKAIRTRRLEVTNRRTRGIPAPEKVRFSPLPGILIRPKAGHQNPRPKRNRIQDTQRRKNAIARVARKASPVRARFRAVLAVKVSVHVKERGNIRNRSVIGGIRAQTRRVHRKASLQMMGKRHLPGRNLLSTSLELNNYAIFFQKPTSRMN